MLGLLLAPRHAAAERALELSWDAPANCPQESAVRERIHALRGNSTHPGSVRAEGHVVRVQGRYRLTLRVREGETVRERAIDADACEDLAGAAAVALGLLLRDESGAPATSTEPHTNKAENGGPNPQGAAGAAAASATTGNATTNTTPAATAAKNDAERASAPARTSSSAPSPKAREQGHSERSLRLLLRAPLLTLDVGPLPKPSGGLGVGAGVGTKQWRAFLLGRILKAQTLSSDEFADAGVRVERGTLELWGCRTWSAGPVDGGPCVGFGGERFAARGTGLGVSGHTEHALSFTLIAGVTGQVHLFSGLALAASLSGGLETSRPHFSLAGLGEVAQLGPAWFSLGIGPEWIF